MAHVSLEPLPIYASDGKDGDVFARPPRLADVVLQDGSEVYSRVDPKKSLQERLVRVWAERGDYSLVTVDSIRNSTSVEPESDERRDQDALGRPSSDEMRKFAEAMLNNLTIARGELSTALDLLNVLSPATDPPNVDVNTIPLPHETLTLVPTSVPPPPSYSDPSSNALAPLPLAESLEAIKLSANLFFKASEDLVPLDEPPELSVTTKTDVTVSRDKDDTSASADPEPQLTSSTRSAPSPSTLRKRTHAPDPWPTILSLHSSAPSRSLLPLGAVPGAALTGKHEQRAARQVGAFYGCEEASREFRRASVASVAELVSPDVERTGGRRICIELRREGRGDDNSGEGEGGTDPIPVVERHVWDDFRDRDGPDEIEDQRDDRGVEGILRRRNRSAFAEELFANLVHEAKTDTNLGAQYRVGNLSRSDSIALKPIGCYQLEISMVPPTTKLESTRPGSALTPIALLSPLLRLLFLGEYSDRRRRPQAQAAAAGDRPPQQQQQSRPRARPLLGTVATVLRYVHRVDALRTILAKLSTKILDEEEEKDRTQRDAARDDDDDGGDKAIEVETELWSRDRKLSLAPRRDVASGGPPRWSELSGDVLNIVRGDGPELGGRALITLNKRYTFHILFSLPLPTHPDTFVSTTSGVAPTKTPLLALRSPGKAQPVSIPSMAHLEGFLKSEVSRVMERDGHRLNL